MYNCVTTTTINIHNISISPQISASSFAVCSQLLALGATNVLSAIIILSFLVFLINKIKQYILFCIYFTYSNAFESYACCCKYQYFSLFHYCYINEPKTDPVYWLLNCLFLHNILKSISSKAHWQQTQIFTHSIVLKTTMLAGF